MPRRDPLARIPAFPSPLFVLLLLLPLALPFFTPAARARRQAEFAGRVVAVPAGDSLEVARRGHGDHAPVLVRLHGVECPPAPRALKEVCARFTARLALGSEVRVLPKGRGPDGALWAEVLLAGEENPPAPSSLNVALVGAGLARWKDGYAPERDDLRRAQERAASAGSGLWGADDGSNVVLPTAPPRAQPAPAAAPAAVAAPLSPPRAGATTAAARGPDYVGGLGVFLVAFGVTLGAFVLRDVGQPAPAGAAVVAAPGERLAARLLVAAVGGVAAALLAALPRELIRSAAVAVAPQDLFRAAAVVGCALFAAILLTRGAARLASARRWRAARELDPARAAAGAALPAFGKVHGVARPAAAALLAGSEISPSVRGLWLRETAGVYSAARERRALVGGRRPKGRWRQAVTEKDAGGLRIESDAGDGTGVALVRWGCGDAPGAPRVLPYVVARHYNGMAVRRWFRTPYEGDTRSETLLLPDGARVTAWGVLLPPREPGSPPELVPDPLTGEVLIADDAVAARVGARDRADAALCLTGGLPLAVAALGLAFPGVSPLAPAALCSTLGALLLAGLVTGLRRAVRLTRAARGLPGREAAALRLRRWSESRPGRLLAAAVG